MSKRKQGLVDTNLLIRYYIDDDPQKVDAVEKLLKNSQEKLSLLDITFAEIIWVLSSVYGLDKKQIIEKLNALLNVQSIICNRRILRKSLEYFANYNISFIDAYQASYAEINELDVYSYDRDFDKLPQIKRVEPE